MKIITVCGWCPDAKAKTAAVIAQGCKPSHTVCPSCEAKLF
jgi:hypothetical protein